MITSGAFVDALFHHMIILVPQWRLPALTSQQVMIEPVVVSVQAAGLVKRVMCCNAGPTLVGSCDPYVCLGELVSQQHASITASVGSSPLQSAGSHCISFVDSICSNV